MYFLAQLIILNPSIAIAMAMILGVNSAAFSLVTPSGATVSSSSSSLSMIKCGYFKPSSSSSVVVSASSQSTVVVFEPFEEMKNLLLPCAPHTSIARHNYSQTCESAINQQINVEYNVSYVYHAMYAYFDRDNVALKGLARFFKESSAEERKHAEKFMDYQNHRGGKVMLQSISMPVSEFDHADKGDALHAMELALSLEKLTNQKLLDLHTVASQYNDVELANFIVSEFLSEQAKSLKKISEYVAQLRRVGQQEHGVWHFDQMLLNE